MRTAIILAAVLVASPAQAKPWLCVLWPTTCQVPAAQIPAPEPPAAAVAPIQAAPPVVPTLRSPELINRPKRNVAKPARVKSKFAKPKRVKRADQPARTAWWCSRIPAGTTMAQVDAAASGFGKTLTVAQRQQTQACIAGK